MERISSPQDHNLPFEKHKVQQFSCKSLGKLGSTLTSGGRSHTSVSLAPDGFRPCLTPPLSSSDSEAFFLLSFRASFIVLLPRDLIYEADMLLYLTWHKGRDRWRWTLASLSINRCWWVAALCLVLHKAWGKETTSRRGGWAETQSVWALHPFLGVEAPCLWILT